jgi:hypothetical protein
MILILIHCWVTIYLIPNIASRPLWSYMLQDLQSALSQLIICIQAYR